MKNRNLIKKNYLNKIKELKEHNQHYYEKSSPKISDADYDKLKLEITDLEKKIRIRSKSWFPLRTLVLEKSNPHFENF